MMSVSSVKTLPTQDDLDTIRKGVRSVVTRFDDINAVIRGVLDGERDRG